MSEYIEYYTFFFSITILLILMNIFGQITREDGCRKEFYRQTIKIVIKALIITLVYYFFHTNIVH